MTQENKELLLKDLCTRLPYGVQCSCTWSHEVPNGTTGCIQELSTFLIEEIEIMDNPEYDCQICEIKPYLRPMSSMTEEEKVYLSQRHFYEGESAYANVYIAAEVVDWMTEHHLDFRGLIPKGLALEAPNGMYNVKEK
jgi:hypothetical protein